jgi:hypothetical protein
MDDRLASVVEATNRNREQFERFCRALDEAELVRPIPESHWRVKDYISHLASMDIWMLEWFEAMVRGDRFIPRADDGGPFDIDAWNDARINERRDASVEQLLTEAERERTKLMATFPAFSGEALASRFNFRGRDVSFMDYLEMWTLHDPAHSLDMLKALPEKKQEPWIRGWIDAFKADSIRLVADAAARG